MSDSKQMPSVFINYDDRDADFVDWLSQSLKVLGHNIWLDRQDLLGGVQTLDATQQALDQSEVMLLLITPDSMRSKHINSA